LFRSEQREREREGEWERDRERNAYFANSLVTYASALSTRNRAEQEHSGYISYPFTVYSKITTPPFHHHNRNQKRHFDTFPCRRASKRSGAPTASLCGEGRTVGPILQWKNFGHTRNINSDHCLILIIVYYVWSTSVCNIRHGAFFKFKIQAWNQLTTHFKFMLWASCEAIIYCVHSTGRHHNNDNILKVNVTCFRRNTMGLIPSTTCIKIR
jgi:hypothetical protein